MSYSICRFEPSNDADTRSGCKRWFPLAAVLALSWLAAAPMAQATNFICDTTGGNWTAAADWTNCNGTFPNNGGGNTYDATITSGTSTLNSAVTVANVTVNSSGDWTASASGSTIGLTGGLSNSGLTEIDLGGSGGTTVNIAGTLTNSGATYIGNGGITQVTTVTAGGLSNTGSLTITGSASTQAALDIGAAAPTTWTGTANLAGDALLQFTGTGQIGTIGSGAQINLNGPQAFVAAAGLGSTSNSALGGLTSNEGTFILQNGAAVTTGGGLGNSGTIEVDLGGQGGSTLGVTGTFTNSGATYIGNGGISHAATLTAGGLSNTGTIDITGGATSQAILQLGTGVTTIASGATLNLENANAQVQLTGNSSNNSGLSSLSSNAGTFTLQ
ncbi:MAG: hypothetical protein JO081_11210, partial [Alphaproteobacteria bacterium]|nr:hypothetical protein [Alphaproteobacteria bacterium]